MRWFPIILILSLLTGRMPHAQEADAYKFQPPPPPPLADEPDFDELDEEGFEADEEGFRPPPPPPMPGVDNSTPSQLPMQPPTPAPPPPPDFRTNNAAYVSSPGQFRFRIVDGEFWQKGKKRSRGRKVLGRSN